MGVVGAVWGGHSPHGAPQPPQLRNGLTRLPHHTLNAAKAVPCTSDIKGSLCSAHKTTHNHTPLYTNSDVPVLASGRHSLNRRQPAHADACELPTGSSSALRRMCPAWSADPQSSPTSRSIISITASTTVSSASTRSRVCMHQCMHSQCPAPFRRSITSSTSPDFMDNDGPSLLRRETERAMSSEGGRAAQGSIRGMKGWTRPYLPGYLTWPRPLKSDPANQPVLPLSYRSPVLLCCHCCRIITPPERRRLYSSI